MLNAEIITIGNELLFGKQIDTNSTLMAEMLTNIGIRVSRIVSIADDETCIIDAISDQSAGAKITLFSGGLGPTSDDITKETAAKCFGSPLLLNHDVLQHIENMFAFRKLPITETNKKQALVPEKATVLFNDLGTAPGLVFTENNHVYIFLPAVPFELENLMVKKVIPFLENTFSMNERITHCDFVFSGIGESNLFDLIDLKTTILKAGYTVAFLPSPGMIKCRVSILHSTKENVQHVFENIEVEFKQLASQYYVGKNITNIASILQKQFIENQMTLSVAESCTGGNISHLITSNAGSSLWFLGGVIAYSNHVKIEQLTVCKQVLDENGAVSKEVVCQMADGVRKKFSTDWGIAVSGIAGPDGGSTEKPVGTVWIAVSSKQSIEAKLFQFVNAPRHVIIERASIAALMFLKEVSCAITTMK